MPPAPIVQAPAAKPEVVPTIMTPAVPPAPMVQAPAAVPAAPVAPPKETLAARLERICKAIERDINTRFVNGRVNLALVGDKLVVTGVCKDVEECKQILNVVQMRAPGRGVLNLLRIPREAPVAQTPASPPRSDETVLTSPSDIRPAGLSVQDTPGPSAKNPAAAQNSWASPLYGAAETPKDKKSSTPPKEIVPVVETTPE